MCSNSSLFGRDPEISQIAAGLDSALNSHGQILLISGEAGIGKSSLVGYMASEAKVRGIRACIGDCTLQDAVIPYIGFQNALSGILKEDLFCLEEFAHYDEIFLISKVGLLISHVSRSESEGMDEDILGSMLTAVQDFVKDSFGGGASHQKGGLGRLEYMNTKITIEHGDLAYLAVVTSGEEHPDMKHDIKSCLVDIESRFFDILEDWDGDIDSLSDSIGMLESLAAKKYRVKRSLENLNLQSERLKVQNRIHGIIESESRESGLLLVLEDIHWADESTLLALPFIARNISADKVVLCLTYRSEDIEDNSILDSIIKELKMELGARGIELNNIDDAAVNGLVSHLLGDELPPEELMCSLQSEAQGNPFFVIESIRALMAEGTLIKDNDVWIMKHGPKTAIPHTVVELVSRRLESLGLDSLRLLEYGAVLGRRFSTTLLESGFTFERSHFDVLTEQLVTSNIFNRVGKNDLMFQHSRIQEVIYSGMSERWKRASHRNAGITYEAQCGQNLDEALFHLAYHFSRTLEFDKGIEYCISAGYKASNNLAPREASQFFEKAAQLIEETKREDARYMEINQMLGELYELDGNYEKSLSVLDKIIGRADDARSANAFMVKGRVMLSQSRYDDAIQSYEKGIALAEGSGLTLVKAKINGYLGKVYLRKGEYGNAMELQNNYLAESRKAGVQRDIGQAYMNLGGVYWSMGNQHMAIRQWEESLKIFVNEDYRQGIANVNDNLGVGFSTLCDFEKSLGHYSKSEEIMLKIGDVRGLSMVLLNIGVLYNRMGLYDKSLEFNMKSLQIKKKIGDSVGVANIYNNIGGNLQDMGRYEEAIEYYKKNYGLMKLAGDVWGIARAMANIAMVNLEIGAFSEAKELCMQSLDISMKHSFNDLSSYSNLFLGVIASHGEDMDSAETHFENGLSLAKTTEDPLIIGQAYLYIARHCTVLKDYGRAMDNYASSFETFEKSNIEAEARKVRQEMQGIMEHSAKLV